MSDIQYPENGTKNVKLKSTDLCGNTRNGVREVNIIQRLLEGQYISILEDGDKATISADVSADYYNKAQINELLGDLDTVKFKVVSVLPAVGAENVIYLVPKASPEVGYEQYIWDSRDGVFYPIGDTDIDLSDYYTKEQSDERYYNKTETYSQTEADAKFQEKLTASDSSATLSDTDKVSKVDPDAKTVTNYPMLSIWNYIKSKFTGTSITPVIDNTRISGVDFTKANPNQYFTAGDLFGYVMGKLVISTEYSMDDNSELANVVPGTAPQIRRVTGSAIWNYIKSKFNADTLTSVTDSTKIGSVDKTKTNPVQEFTAATLWEYIKSKLNVDNLTSISDTTKIGSVDKSKTNVVQQFTASVLFQYMWKKIYPVGCIYTSTSSTSPATLFGGTWAQISDGYYLRASSSGGGNTLNEELPNITGRVGGIVCYSKTTSSLGSEAFASTMGEGNPSVSQLSDGRMGFLTLNIDASKMTNSVYKDNGKVQPKSYKVYMWRRTA